jgi:TM2 domain-containing membrane protein YozV
MSNDPYIPPVPQEPGPLPPPVSSKPVSEKKLIAGLLGILIGCLGIHKFYLGYQKEGIIMLLVSVLTCGIAAAVPAVIGIVEGILYLTKSDEEFERTYLIGRKPWF